jgi:hypothetical protein
MYSFGLGVAVATKRNGTPSSAHALAAIAPVVAGEERHRLAEGLGAAEAAQDRGLVQAHRHRLQRATSRMPSRTLS